MTQRARLITPKGKMIDLSPEIYKQIRQLLVGQNRRRSRAKTDQAIRSTYGKYANGAALTQALLAERKADLAREQTKLTRFRG